ncbi:MAG: polysaccharide export protein [Sphingobacteriales bacterium]|nr:MAG: polysaccharide export protein [Sphingobacteriales bacterium]
MSKPVRMLVACVGVTLMALCLFACTSAKPVSYFQTITRDTLLQNTVTQNFDLKIKPGDQLVIAIASTSPELSALYNTAPGGEGGTGGYLVDKEGTISLYKLGEVKVAGMTRTEVKTKLLQELSPYLKDPVVTVRFANHRVTVLGEVGNPGVINLTAEGITLLEAIGQSGDLTENGKRDRILVIRQAEGGKEFRHLNLLDHSVFTSPYFYLRNEDVVYVEPEAKKEPQKTQQTISYIISGISILSLIISRIR